MNNKLLGKMKNQSLAINTIEECKDVMKHIEDNKIMKNDTSHYDTFESYTFNQKVLYHINSYLENCIATLSNKNLEELVYFYNDGDIRIAYKYTGVSYKSISLDTFKKEESK